MTEPSGSETAIREFEEAWQRGECPAVDAYLSQFDDPGPTSDAFISLLMELVCIDLEFRRRNFGADNRKRVEDYLAEFPQLIAGDDVVIELAAEEYRARHRWGDAPAHEEYAARFKADCSRLCAELARVDDELHAETDVESTFDVRADGVRFPIDSDATPLQFGDYLLQRQIGAGAIGKVYRAFQKSLQRTVAVKFLRKAFCNQPRAVQRFIDEARMVARLSHRGIVGIHGLGRTPGGGYFIVMDYIEQGDLQQQIATGEVTPRQAAGWVAEASEAIQHAHEHGVVHCDLKPGNLLLDGGGHIRVTDFGFARSLEAEEMPLSVIAGTACFMAPEQISDHFGPISRQTDVYGLGGILYALLTGRPPYPGDRVGDILTNVISAQTSPDPIARTGAISSKLNAICCKCLASNRSERFESAAELGVVLAEFISAK